MKKALFFSFLLCLALSETLTAQPLKTRPDAFPWQPDNNPSKAISMASTVEEMAAWNRYPTYETYLAMMQQWATDFPTLCHIDTIGSSLEGRLILSLYIEKQTDDDLYRPEFFYSSSMHGDELTGFIMMLHLIDTLLNGYGSNQQYTDLIDRTRISINPLSNPDGTYHGGNNTVANAWRYNSNGVDLNRNYPDPFGTDPLDEQQHENTLMINYLSNHNFRLSANLHGGSEVLNYPWDSFTSSQQQHPERPWWIEVCSRFIDTSRSFNAYHFRDVINSGYIEGGDWYVIPNGRQDYVNYYHNCLEMTMELSTVKTISSNQLPEYWHSLQNSLVNYIGEIHSLPGQSTEGIDNPSDQNNTIAVYPIPARDKIMLPQKSDSDLFLYNMQGKCLMHLPAATRQLDIQSLPNGIYLLRSGNRTAKVVKQ